MNTPTPPTDKDALIASLLERIEVLMAQNAALAARVAELEAKLGLPPKTPDNSSLPPSKGQKPSLPSVPTRKAKPHPGAYRLLHPNPTRHHDVLALACQACGADVSEAEQSPCEVYRKITNGFRQEWGAHLYADIRSVIETARQRSVRAIDAIRLTLKGQTICASA